MPLFPHRTADKVPKALKNKTYLEVNYTVFYIKFVKIMLIFLDTINIGYKFVIIHYKPETI